MNAFSTILATFVAAGFAWSTVLFFAAVFIREREQEAGFLAALAGAVLFVVVFADRLLGQPLALRDAVSWLPSVDAEQTLFTSSLAALVLLFVIYLFRVAVFYHLFIKGGKSLDDNGKEEIVNDEVAQLLSYSCFAICLVSLLQPAYVLNPFVTFLLVAGLAAAHWWTLLLRLQWLVRLLRVRLTVAWAFVRHWTSRFVVKAIARIVELESIRYPDGGRDLSEWTRRQLESLDRRREEAIREQETVLEGAAHHARRRPRRKDQRGTVTG